MLQLHNLRKHYDGKEVVKGVSLQLPERQVIALIGPNGAGKSTVLHMVAHLTAPDAGTIHLNGRALPDYSRRELAQELAFLAQQHQIASKLTVYELVSFGRFPYSQGQLTEQDQALIAQALDFMELTALSERFLDELSGGQRQRALIAMVLAQDTNCDYICAFKDGAIARYGTVSEVMQEDFLREVYQVDFTLTQHKGKPLALHF